MRKPASGAQGASSVLTASLSRTSHPAATQTPREGVEPAAGDTTYSDNGAKISRRAIMNMMVSAAAVAASSVAVAAHEANEGDAELLALVKELSDWKPIYEQVSAAYQAVGDRLDALRPPRPSELRKRHMDFLNLRHWRHDISNDDARNCYFPDEIEKKLRGVQQVKWNWASDADTEGHKWEDIWDNEEAAPVAAYKHLFKCEPDPKKQARADEILAAHDRYSAAVEAVKADIGYREAEKQLNEVYFERVLPLQERIADLEPQTLAGVRAKAQYLLDWWFEDQSDDEMTEYDKLICDVVVGVARLVA
jgi:hypothetical protein